MSKHIMVLYVLSNERVYFDFFETYEKAHKVAVELRDRGARYVGIFAVIDQVVNRNAK